MDAGKSRRHQGRKGTPRVTGTEDYRNTTETASVCQARGQLRQTRADQRALWRLHEEEIHK